MEGLGYDEAAQLLKQTVELRTHVQGAEHPDTLRSMEQLLRSYRMRSQHERMAQLEEQTAERRKIELGTGHPATLESMRNLAILLAKSA